MTLAIVHPTAIPADLSANVLADMLAEALAEMPIDVPVDMPATVLNAVPTASDAPNVREVVERLQRGA